MENNTVNKVVVYFDFLGFKHFIESNFTGGVGILDKLQNYLLQEYNDFVDTLNCNIKSFETVIPMSDSVFIVSDDINIFIEEFSRFIFQIYYYNIFGFIDNDNDEPFKVECLNINNHQEPLTEYWFPAIFNGGLALGPVKVFDSLCLNKNTLKDQLNIAGEGVINAYKTSEDSNYLKGPFIFISKEAYSELNSYNKNKIINVSISIKVNDNKSIIKDLYILCWTSFVEDAYYFDLIKSVLIIINHYENIEKAKKHYLGFLYLLIEGYGIKNNKSINETKEDILKHFPIFNLNNEEVLKTYLIKYNGDLGFLFKPI